VTGLRRRDFLRSGLAAAVLGATGPAWARQSDQGRAPESPKDSGWDQLPSILANIVPPTFPDNDFAITDYGAVDSPDADAAPALAAAIAACNRAGGGRVVVPAGQWMSNGPIHLLSNVNLYLEAGATIKFTTDPNRYLPVQLVRWQGVRCYNYSPLIYAYQQENIAITGSGTLDGQGSPTWYPWVKKQTPDWTMLQEMAREGVPVEKRIFGPDHFLRPGFFEPYDCKNILVEGVTLQGSPFWTLHPTFCTNVTIQEVTVWAGTANDDGCDPDSCEYVLVAGCSFSTNDDNVSIKAGLNPDAVGLPSCENIVIQSCNCLSSDWSGLTIGTQVGGVVRNVFIENCTTNNSINAHFIKGHANWGGGVEDIYIRSNHIYSCDSLLALKPDSDDEAGTMGPPRFSNINLADITCEDAKAIAFNFTGDARLPIDGVVLIDISFENAKKLDVIANTAGIEASEITLKGKLVSLEG
jgi:polygalacturonase